MIDVIIPVYSGEAHVRRCIASVLASTCSTPFELIVVDDCSPEPALSAWLGEGAAKGQFTLLVNKVNRGFVGSVNRALAVHSERDAVILNSDTEVAGNWLDRLHRCAVSAPDIATVTPFSNNGTICSYPFEGWNGGVPGGLGLPALDALFSRTLADVVVDLPTAVGFCMYLCRPCLDVVGAFDEDAFGRGYGEENDYSLRAAKAGWRNVLCASAYVYHCGGVSFGTERVALMQSAERVLGERHPDYADRVRAFRKADPLAPLFADIDLARRAQGVREAEAVFMERAEEHIRYGVHRHTEMPPRPVTLHVVHAWGGGIERWVRDYAAADRAGWNLLLRSRPGRNDAGMRLELIDLLASEQGVLVWELSPVIGATAIEHPQYRKILDAVIASFSVEAIFVSSLIGHSLDALETRLPTAVVLHDLYPFCPALFGWFDGVCTRCEGVELTRCLESNPQNVFWQHDDVDAWLQLRQAYSGRIEAANVHIFAPSRVVHDRYAALFPVIASKPWNLVPHGLGQYPLRAGTEMQSASLSSVSRDRLRVLIPGRLSPHKGLNLFAEIVNELREFADVLLLGCGGFGTAFEGIEHVEVVREYANDSLPRHVRDFSPDCALLLSVLPESFSYTLSEMFALGIPVVATCLGAFAERIQDGANGILVAPDAAAILACLRTFDRDRVGLAVLAQELKAHRESTASDMVSDYRRALCLHLPSAPKAGADLMRLLLETLHRAHAEKKWLHGEYRRLQDEMRYVLKREQELADRLEKIALDSVTNRTDAEQLRKRLWVVERQLEAMLASHSWRATLPLRRLSEMLLGNEPPLSDPGEIRPDQAAPVSGPVGSEEVERPSSPDPASEEVFRSARGIVYRASDPITERRARLTGETLRMPCLPDEFLAKGSGDRSTSLPDEECDAGISRNDLFPGFVCYMPTAPLGDGRPDEFECVAWFEGTDDQEPHLNGWPVAVRKSRVMVPSHATQDLFFRVYPDSRASVLRCDFPLVGDWPHAASHLSFRDEKLEALGVPDRTRLVVGMGRLTANDGFQRFASVACEIARTRNDFCFVWLGSGRDDWLRENFLKVAEPVGLGRLFILEGEAFEPWLLAANVYLGCRATGVYDGGTVEAAAAGLPVVVESAGSLPDALSGDMCSDLINVCSTPDVLGGSVVEAAKSAAQKTVGSYAESAGRVLAHFGSEAIRAAFVRACRGK